jgi:beta-aspartyl-peptidase (threonine type)
MRLELKEPDASSSAEEDGRGGLSVEVDDEHVEAQHGQLRELFDKIKGEDGKLRPAELAQLAQELEMQLSQSQLDEAMAQMDRDGDGAVEWPEFLGWVQSKVVDVSGGLTPVRGVRRSVNPIIVAESQQQQQQRAVSSAASARSVTFDPQLGDATPESSERDGLLGAKRAPGLASMGPSLSEQITLEGEPLITPKSYLDFRANLSSERGILGIKWLSHKSFFIFCAVLTVGTIFSGVVLDAVRGGQGTAGGPGVGYAMAIHGGAGTIRRELMSAALEEQYRTELAAAVDAGEAVLAGGGSALDAVVASIQVMEESELFNAGRGAVFTHAGTIEMDASIMDGRHRRPPPNGAERWSAGAVASVTRVRSPIACARTVMMHSNHVMLAGAGADQFCEEQGLPQESMEYFATERRYAQLMATVNSSATQLSEDEGRRRRRQLLQPTDQDQDHRRRMQQQEQQQQQQEESGAAVDWGEVSVSSDSVLFDLGKYGTVGAVARDKAGHLAAATSTGGLSNKQHGRVGDAPIVGAGTWAKDATAAISATGHGEVFIQEAAASSVSARMEYGGVGLSEAIDKTLQSMDALWPESGGMVGVDFAGQVEFGYSTGGMYRAWKHENGSAGVRIWEE